MLHQTTNELMRKRLPIEPFYLGGADTTFHRATVGVP